MSTPKAGKLGLGEFVEPNPEIQTTYEQDLSLLAKEERIQAFEALRFKYILMKMATWNRHQDKQIQLSPASVLAIKENYRSEFGIEVSFPDWLIYEQDLNDKYLPGTVHKVIMTPQEWWHYVCEVTGQSKSNSWIEK